MMSLIQDMKEKLSHTTKLKRVKCPDCNKKVIPWDFFPKDLVATSSCSEGVHTFIKREIAERAEAALEAERQKALNEKAAEEAMERAQENAEDHTEEPPEDPGDNYDGPDEAQEWYDFDPEA